VPVLGESLRFASSVVKWGGVIVSRLGQSLRREEGFPLTLKNYLKWWIPVLGDGDRTTHRSYLLLTQSMQGGQGATKAIKWSMVILLSSLHYLEGSCVQLIYHTFGPVTLEILISHNRHNFNIYREHTATDITIHNTSYQPPSHKNAASLLVIRRLDSIPLNPLDY